MGAVEPIQDLGAIVAYTAAFVGTRLLIERVALPARQGPEEVPSGRQAIRVIAAHAVGSGLAVVLALFLQRHDLSLLLLAAPFAYLFDLVYRARAQRAEEERRHSRVTAELYESVTLALARAIEAKDENKDEHLRRVQRLALGVGERLGLAGPEMEALRAATLLHDIGKIAVPEYILTKPGRLTPEETEMMKIHPEVGATILSAVPFPYPLAPIVRHHHERWDGNGYPDRLAGKAIPLGARILTLVDSFDALTSDRPYRKAVSREEALEYVRRESGRIFDPDLVDILSADIDTIDSSPAPGPERLHSEGVFVAPDRVPRAPAEAAAWDPRARDETLQRMARIADGDLELEDSLSLLSARLGRLVPFRSLVLYGYDPDRRRLLARFATGQAAEKLRSVAIPVGERLSGWVALHQKPYSGRSHANPLDRDGSRSDLEDLAFDPEIAELRSALVAPVASESQDFGVLALYHATEHVYGPEQLSMLVIAASHFARALRSASSAERWREEGLIDLRTGVPNWRFYILDAEHRVAAAPEGGPSVGLLAFQLEPRERLEELRSDGETDRLISAVARKLAARCGAGECLVRISDDVLVVLTPEDRSRVLAARCRALLQSVEDLREESAPEAAAPVRLRTAQAHYPVDGDTPEKLLRTLEQRLHDPSTAFAPVFPAGRWSSLGLGPS